MSEEKKGLTIYQIADQFIALANQLSQQENDIGKVGTGMRYAASRFNAFEAAIKSTDLAAEKDNALEWFSNEYKEMLDENLKDHIAYPPGAKREEEKSDNGVETFTVEK
ncbi:DUF3144 domain-containing protein [Shewanella intestini]|uniref:DUF3144 domain-containing protein n=1 Tax=Shewanella intestini TaxID=2017544 RepID=A0ABS5HXE5_9GAMM|nr:MULTISPECIES: DUF3144 domain-containing protein [Shewanella]MBR9726394.1 DUF3144 domain-containing protein [Shewanella intestini]MRG35040.1 DUF3144 domain-containing protein [Shewanella sp. XMDDZSB0408]